MNKLLVFKAPADKSKIVIPIAIRNISKSKVTRSIPKVDELVALRDALHTSVGRLKQSSPSELSEHQEQCLVISWCSDNSAIDPRLSLIFAIPNGLWAKNPGSARKAKAEGLKKGVPDLFLPVAGSGAHGLFIEMKKTNKSRTSSEQKQWLADLQQQGYASHVCKGHEQAIVVLKEYLDWARD